MQLFSPVPGRSFPPRNRQVFGPPYQGQQFGSHYQGQRFGAPYQGRQFGQTYDNRWNPSFISPNNSSPGILGNLLNHLNTLMGHAGTIKNGYNMMRQLGSFMSLFR
ncbi:hypothetical protein JFL43_09285 [Viridibacillus sp. YIM B01967]|uniref:Spore coat protein n=1 Tax=Viridibacillus soli TaxID=2798301 RepID=A0ABS1H6K7_9BACL|nr:hypothetical protein [Viridibacillus soli]MBK3495049.1 hypothetical protein [Viridibacillus soli]